MAKALDAVAAAMVDRSRFALLPLLCLMLGAPASVRAVDVAVANGEENRSCDEPVLQAYEPNTFGYTKQSDDEWFIDVTLSVKMQMFRDWFCKPTNGALRLYLAVTTRFGFYVRTRDSGPVVGKEYNPKALLRWIPSTSGHMRSVGYDDRTYDTYEDYLDFAYAHSSDGQTIDSLAAYQLETIQAGSAADALDYISRGWDYVQIEAKTTSSRTLFRKDDLLTLYPDFKFFLRHGLFQGVPEEYHSWEEDSALRPRHAFDGVSAEFEYKPFGRRADDPDEAHRASLRLAFKYQTGYDPFARYNTLRGEIGYSAWGLPITLWAQDGYMNSLARYFKKARSIGLELRFAEFDSI
jgi:hypothetical protein